MSVKIERTYEMWHQKNVDAAFEQEIDFPEGLACVGRAETIYYESDKWEKDGHFVLYVHEFDSGPFVYFGEGEDVSTKHLLGVRNLRGELALPVLAFVTSLTYARDNKPHKTLNFKDPPTLVCTADRKTLVIFSKEKGPIFISGGKMVVTERGIER